MLITYKLGQGSVVLRIKIPDTSRSDNGGVTGLTSGSTGLNIAISADNEATSTVYSGANIESITTLGTYAAPTSGKIRFKEFDAANHPGVYEIQAADSRFNVSSAKSVVITIKSISVLNVAQTDATIPLTVFDPYASTSSPSAAQIATTLLTDLLSSTDFNTTGSFGKLIKDNLNAPISAIPTGDAYSIVSNGSYGNAAIATSITNLNNLSALSNLFGPNPLVRPFSGSIDYPFTFVVKDVEGHLIDVDTNAVILTAVNAAGTDRSANLSSVTHSGTGEYKFTYTVASTHAYEGLAITASGFVQSATRKAYLNTSIEDAEALSSIAAIKAKTDLLTFVSSRLQVQLTSDGIDNISNDGYNLRQVMYLIAADLFGKLAGLPVSPATFRSIDDTANRIVMAFDSNNNRTSVTLTPPA